MYAIVKKRKSNGSCSDFYKLKNSKLGFKTFGSYECAYEAHYHQKYLSQYDLAPMVYSDVGRVRIGNSKELSDWGYVTEIAQTIGCGGNGCYCCDRDALESEWYDEMDQLFSDMEDIGYYFGDNHIGNVGLVSRYGSMKMVCIDTGGESVTCDHGPCFCLVCKKGGNCRG